MIKGSCKKSIKMVLKNVEKRSAEIEKREQPRDEDSWYNYVEAYRDLIGRIQNDLRLVVD